MESSEYELVRNLTLLFFLERLLDKGGPRTLHDLSCQFGAKGFTKEMRQIAGGSQSGLRKFLTQYPSLFSIDGDYVYVNAFAAPADTQQDSGLKYVGGKRDYAQEAVEYFSNKLMQYGPGTEVPIKSLLGHRSQASPEVRHISGQHVKEFRDFLLRYPESFVVGEETVVLKEWEGREPQPFYELEQVHVDPAVTSRLLGFLSQCVEMKGPMLVDQLFHAVASSRIPQDQWACMFKTPQDLSTFLKMHSDAFHVQSNLVTLISLPPQTSPTRSCKPSPQQCSPNHQNNNNNNNNVMNVSSNPVTLSSVNNNIEPPSPPQPPPTLQNQTLKQRINSLVMKTIADNTERDRSYAATSLANNALATGGNPGGDVWKVKLLQSTKVIVTVKESLQIVDDIMSRAASEKVAVSFDCEGINLGVKGQLTLFQLGTSSGLAYIFDLVTCPGLVSSGGLQHLLESESVTKVLHDCRNDSVNLYNQFGITLRNVFDTQAAHAVLQLQELGKPVYKVKNVSLNALCEMYDAPVNPMKDQLKNVYRRDQRYWARRPLTRDMMLYAAADVLALVPQVYNAMTRLIKPEYESLLKELCEEQVFMHIKPGDVKQRKKQRKVETELADLRGKLSASTNKTNIVLSNREIRLLRYLDLTEEEKEKLKGSYKVARKLEKLENLQDRDGKSDDEDDDEDFDGCNGDSGDFPSLEHSGKTSPSSGGLTSPRTPVSEPLSLTESMQLLDEILSDGRMERLDKIERLEAILSVITSPPGGVGGTESTPPCCACQCHVNLSLCNQQGVSGSKEQGVCGTRSTVASPGGPVDVACQTLSTGDIVITRIFFTEEEKEREKTLTSSPKRGSIPQQSASSS